VRDVSVPQLNIIPLAHRFFKYFSLFPNKIRQALYKILDFTRVSHIFCDNPLENGQNICYNSISSHRDEIQESYDRQSKSVCVKCRADGELPCGRKGAIWVALCGARSASRCAYRTHRPECTTEDHLFSGRCIFLCKQSEKFPCLAAFGC
jgi:hypothetical protein